MDKELSWSTFIMTLFYAFGLKSLVIFILNMECHAYNISLGLTFPSCLCMSAAASRPLEGQGGTVRFHSSSQMRSAMMSSLVNIPFCVRWSHPLSTAIFPDLIWGSA